MTETLLSVLPETAQVVLLVFIMMVLVDLVNVWTHGRIASLLRGAHRWRQYVVASTIGAAPGCVGGFLNVSLYVHGMISFGALAGSMVATSGDEAFVMLAMFPRSALPLMAALAVLGMALGWLTDTVMHKARIRTCTDCPAQIVHASESGTRHYLIDHVWKHIILKHLWKVGLWTLAALLIVEAGMRYAHLQDLAAGYPFAILILSAVFGLIPQSGPHLLFVSMYASGLVPFSVLVTSAIVQDGHSMLPMLAHSVRDSLILKFFNLVFGLIIGSAVFAAGF
jgi:hypothetical protein